MPTPISSIVPVSAASPVADAATPDLVLQAGSVVDARVVSVMADNLVRIAIANLSMDVMSEVSLTPGQNLQLAVSQNDGTIRLAIMNGAGEATADQITLTPRAASLVDSPSLAPSATTARNTLTPLEQVAVTVASAEAVDETGQPGAAVRQSRLRRHRQRSAGGTEAGGAGRAGAADAAQHRARWRRYRIRLPEVRSVSRGVARRRRNAVLRHNAGPEGRAAGAAPDVGHARDRRATGARRRDPLRRGNRRSPPCRVRLHRRQPSPIWPNSRRCRAAPISRPLCSPTSPAALRRPRCRGPCPPALPRPCFRRSRKTCRA